MSTTLIGVFVGSVLGAVALAIYSVAILLEGRRRPRLNTIEKVVKTTPVVERAVERPTQPLAKPPEPVTRPLPGLPPVATTISRPRAETQGRAKFLAVGSIAEPLRRAPRGSQPPQFRRAVFIDPEFADEAPTEQLARPFVVARRPVRGRA